MNMWSDQNIKNEISKIPDSVKKEIKEKFLNSNRAEYKPPEEIELIFPSCKNDELGFNGFCEYQPKIQYPANFGTMNKAIGGTFPTAA